MAIPYAPLIKSLSGKVFKPTTLAVLASVGIHALMLGVGISLPSKPMFSEEELPTQHRTVSLIELTPAEQTRLPDLSPPSPSLNISLPDASGLNPSPLQSNNNPASLPQISALPPLPNSSLHSSLPGLPSQPPRWQSIRIAPLPGISLPPPPSLNPSPQFRQPQNLQSPVDPDSLIARQRLFENNPPPPRTTPENPRDLINQKLPGQIPVQSSEPTQPQTPYEREISREELRQDSTNTTQEEARKNYVTWLPETEELSPTKLTIAGTYPKDACLKKVEGTAIYGIRVNGNGQMVDSRLIQGAGYTLFNELALQSIQSRSFDNATGKLKPYMVSVDFKYNPKICPLSTVQPNSPAPESSSNPQPTEAQRNSGPPKPNNSTTEVPQNSVPKKPANTATEAQRNSGPPKPNNSTTEVPQNSVPKKPANTVTEAQRNSGPPKPNNSTAEVPQNSVPKNPANTGAEVPQSPVPTNPNTSSGESQNPTNANKLPDSGVNPGNEEP